MTMRACVTDARYERIFTWYDDGTVIVWRRDMDIYQTIRGVHTLAEFSDELLAVGVAPLKSKRPIKPRELEDEFVIVEMELPF